MKLYLSSYKLGNETEKLKQLVPLNKIGYIPNALDFTGVDLERRKKHVADDIQSLQDLGIECELVDLKDYFKVQHSLKDKLDELGALFISGGNVFVLRQAMKLSELDKLIEEKMKSKDFVYAGYSAAGCVLSSNLEAYKLVDDETNMPYKNVKKVTMKGLGLIDYVFAPHWDSDHPESKDIEKMIEYCKQNSIPYRAIKDGEVIIVE